MIYLDNSSTTQISQEVLDEMMPYLTTEFGNAGTIHKLGIDARRALDKARERVAKMVNAKDPSNIIFTSGGTESNNMVIHNYGRIGEYLNKKHVVISEIEHDSIIRPAHYLEKRYGFYVSEIGAGLDGVVDIDSLKQALETDVALVSIMYMNNEVGSINDVKQISNLCHSKGIPYHCDCVQAAGSIELDVDKIGCDYMSISSHKIHGPKGVGALYVRNPSQLSPMIMGGHQQEFGFRGGTENVAGIVGFGKACEMVMQHDLGKTQNAKDLFWKELNQMMEALGIKDIMYENANSASSNPKVLNVCFSGVDAESLVMMLGVRDVFVSAGSACRSHEQEPSRVLKSIGYSDERARDSIRFSFSRMNTVGDAAVAAGIVAETVAKLYSMSH